MKRSKKMLSKFTSLLHNAVEALAPEMTLLDQFRYHWKSVTQFFLDTTDERMSVESTNIPHHLEQMIEVLQQEEQENGVGSAGSAMEFMLQHKILETMQTLGKADCPPGMKRQVLTFFTNLLGKLRQQLLPHVNVHKPVNKLIRCCGQVKAAPTESEEVQFLLQVSSKLKQNSYLVNFFLEKPSNRESGSSPPLSPGMEHNREKPEYSLVDSLLSLTGSEDSRVAIKACEGLLLCTSILEDHAASVTVLYTAFCERMADQLSKLFKCLPAVIDPADMNNVTATWGFDHEDQLSTTFPGKRQMIAFFSWLDYVNQLSVEAHPMVGKALAFAIRERFIQTAIEPGLSQACEQKQSQNQSRIQTPVKHLSSEPCAITVTAVLTRCLKLVTSSTLAQEFAEILLGTETYPEDSVIKSPHKLRRLLIQRINHLSDQLAVETLRLFQALLHLSSQPIIETLVTRNFKSRKYLDFEKYNLNRNKLSRSSSVYSRTSSMSKKKTSRKNSETPKEYDRKDSGIQKDSSYNDIEPGITENKNKIHEHSRNKETENTTGTGKTSKISIENQLNTLNISGENNTEKTANSGSSHNEQNIDLKQEIDEKQSKPTNSRHDLDEGPASTSEQDANRNALENSMDSLEADIHDYYFREKAFNKKRVEKAVNGFLLILPDSLRTSDATGETGYDSYLRDAHKQCHQRSLQTLSYNWPEMSRLDDDFSEEDTGTFYEGAFLNTILQRLQKLLDQPFDINLELTAIVSLLSQFHHPYLHEFLLDASGLCKENIMTPHRILLKVCHELKNRAVKIPNFQQSLISVRKNLSGHTDQISNVPHESIMEGVVLLEEFCKELAAVAFVTATMQVED